MTTKEEDAYMAGIVDAKGLPQARFSKGESKHSPAFTRTQTTIDIIVPWKDLADWMVALYGGIAYLTTRCRGKHTSYRIRFHGDELDRLLSLTIPYLKTKKEMLTKLQRLRKLIVYKTQHKMSPQSAKLRKDAIEEFTKDRREILHPVPRTKRKAPIEVKADEGT